MGLLGRVRRQQIKKSHAEDENLSRGAEFDSKLLFIADIEGELVLDVGIFPLSAGTEAAVEVAPKKRIDAAAGVSGELLRGIANDACVHLVFEESTAEGVLAREDGSGFNISAKLRLVDFPGREA
jgi:hypothetical protein